MALKLRSKTGWVGNTEGYALDVDALEPGDKVAMVHNTRFGGATTTVYTVTRRTRTWIICEGPSWQKEHKFRADDGSPVGDSHYSVLRAPFDPEVLDALESMRITEYHRAHGRVLAKPHRDHDARMAVLAESAELAIQAQNDLLGIRRAIAEWHAQKELADAVR